MKKIMLNMNDLIKFIETNKNIDFKSDTERKRLKNMIEKYDYSNIFSCLLMDIVVYLFL